MEIVIARIKKCNLHLTIEYSNKGRTIFGLYCIGQLGHINIKDTNKLLDFRNMIMNNFRNLNIKNG